MNQEDYKDKTPEVEEEPNEYPPDYQKWLDSLSEMTEDDYRALDKWLESVNERLF